MKIDISKRAKRIAGVKTNCPTASVAAPPRHLLLHRGRLFRCGRANPSGPSGQLPLTRGALVRANKELSRKKVQTSKSGLHLLLMANIQTQLAANPILPYQAARSKKLVE